MPSLHDLQKQFISDLFLETEYLHPFICNTPKLTVKEHLNIYRHSIIGAFQTALKNIFPVCCKIVGTEFFMEMVQQYIQKTPSLSPDIAQFGEVFSEFMTTFTPAKDLVYLSDVAKLEWAWHSISFAPVSPLLNFKILAQHIEKGQTNLQFSPPFQSVLLDSPYPILKIWEVNQDDFTGEPIVILEDHTHFYYLIWRDGNQLRMDILEFADWQLLSWLKEGWSIDQIQEKIQSHPFEFKLDILLPHLVERKLIVDFALVP